MRSGILFGLVAMLGWGVADFYAARASRALGTVPAFFWNQVGGLALLLPFAPFIDWGARWTLANALWLALASVALVAVYLLFYRGLRIGVVAVVSPILAANVVITAAIGLLVFGEHLAPREAAGVGAVIVGLLLASTDWREIARARRGAASGAAGGAAGGGSLGRGVPEALGAMLLAGGVFAILVGLSRRVGWFAPIVGIRAGGLVLGGLIALACGSLRNPGRDGFRLAIPSGALDTIAFLAFNLGVRFAPAAAIAPLGGSFPVVTILLACIALGERPAPNQWVGAATIVVGIVLMA